MSDTRHPLVNSNNRKHRKLKGPFLPFYLPFTGKSAFQQAREILDEVDSYHKQGIKRVGLTYSANHAQTIKINSTYNKDDWYTGTNGGNQAAVIHEIEKLLAGDYRFVHCVEDLKNVTDLNPYAGDSVYDKKTKTLYRVGGEPLDCTKMGTLNTKSAKKFEEFFGKNTFKPMTDYEFRAYLFPEFSKSSQKLKYTSLINCFRIEPITTCKASGGRGKVSNEILQIDLQRIEDHMNDGELILGWQNESKSAKHPFAIGGGISQQLTMKQQKFIQDGLQLLEQQTKWLNDKKSDAAFSELIANEKIPVNQKYLSYLQSRSNILVRAIAQERHNQYLRNNYMEEWLTLALIKDFILNKQKLNSSDYQAKISDVLHRITTLAEEPKKIEQLEEDFNDLEKRPNSAKAEQPLMQRSELFTAFYQLELPGKVMHEDEINKRYRCALAIDEINAYLEEREMKSPHPFAIFKFSNKDYLERKESWQILSNFISKGASQDAIVEVLNQQIARFSHGILSNRYANALKKLRNELQTFPVLNDISELATFLPQAPQNVPPRESKAVKKPTKIS